MPEVFLGNIRGPQGIQGPAGNDGATFIPSVDENGDLSWTNNKGLENPAKINIVGPQGSGVNHWTLKFESEKEVYGDVSNGGFLSWSGVLASSFDFSKLRVGDFISASVTRRHRSTSEIEGPGIVFGTITGWSFTGDVGSVGMTTMGMLYGGNGTTFMPSVDNLGYLNWTNNGGLVNPDSVKVKGERGERGYYFSPFVDSNGNLTWSNNGGLDNPASRNLMGPQGIQGVQGPAGSDGKNGVTFTPAVDASGNLSWTNDGGLTNPPSVNIKGPKGDQGPAGEGGGGGSGDGIPKTGDRGFLGGYNTCQLITDFEGPIEVTIDENSPDDMVIEAFMNGVTLNFVASCNVSYVKNILVYGEPSLVTVNFGELVFVDTFFQSFENDLGLSFINQIVVASYVVDEGDGPYPMAIVSNKPLM